MRLRKVLLTIAAAGVAVAMALPAQAERFRADFTGLIEFPDFSAGDPANAFGLSAGDEIAGFAIYDTDAFFDVGDTPVGFFQTISAGDGTGFVLELSVGTQSFTAADDADFLSGFFPEFLFLDQEFVGFDFISEVNADGFSFQTFALDFVDTFSDPLVYDGRLFFAGLDPDFLPIDGYFRPDVLVRPVDADNNIIPEPGTMVLLGSGLLGLAGYGRKRRKG